MPEHFTYDASSLMGNCALGDVIMDKKIAGLLGAVAALGTVGVAQASPAPTGGQPDALQANSYADLLQPIPNAAALLTAIDEGAPNSLAEAKVQLAQMHHHHHHHSYSRRVVVKRPRHHHHHHHHHHHY